MSCCWSALLGDKPPRRTILLVLVWALLLPGCAAHRGYSPGRGAEYARQHADAVRSYSFAGSKKASDPRYHRALLEARRESTDIRITRAEVLELAGRSDAALRELELAFREEPENDFVLLKRDLLRIRIQAASVAPARPPGLSGAASRAFASMANNSSGAGAGGAASRIWLEPSVQRQPSGTSFPVEVLADLPGPAESCFFDVVFDASLLELEQLRIGATVSSYSVRHRAPGKIGVRFAAWPGFREVACSLVFAARIPGSTRMAIENTTLLGPSGTHIPVVCTPTSVLIADGEQG